MSIISKLLLKDKHVCPWWLAYSWDHRLRTLIHDPGKLIGPYVKPGYCVADVGCGMGFFSIAMAGFVGETGRVFAVDVQQKMLDVLMKRAGRRPNRKSITPVLSDGNRIELDEELDFVLNFWVLHEVDDSRALVESQYDSMRKGGRFLLVEPKVHTTEQLLEEEISLCQEAGFKLVGRPVVRWSRSALFEKT